MVLFLIYLASALNNLDQTLASNHNKVNVKLSHLNRENLNTNYLTTNEMLIKNERIFTDYLTNSFPSKYLHNC